MLAMSGAFFATHSCRLLLFDQRLHFPECRMIGRSQPFEQNHLRGNKLDAGAGQAVEGRIAVDQGAGTAGVGHHPDIERL